MATRPFLVDYDEQSLALSMYSERYFTSSALPPRPAPAYTDGLPRIAFSDSMGIGTSTSSGEATFMKMLRERGFVILTGVDEGARLYRALEQELMRFFHGSFGGCGSPAKEQCVGGVYFNEREVPMWRCGYEYVDDRVREAFRVHAQADRDELQWPTPAATAKWLALVTFCEGLADRAFALTLDDASKEGLTRQDATMSDGRPPKASGLSSSRAASLANFQACRKSGGDMSVAYALHYPNDEGGAPTLPLNVTGGEGGLCVKAHVDPSLIVLEPVADVPGLEVFDPLTQAWVSVERASQRPGEEWVVFGGRCLEAATGVKACLHRVTASNYGNAGSPARRRFCFIYEQKLMDYFDGC